VLLGFSTPDSKQIMDVSEMVSEFSLDRINRSPAVFDINKLLWMNGEYIRMCPTDRLVELSGDILKDRDGSWKRAVIELYRERIKRVSDIEREADFLLQDEIAIDREAEAKILRRDGVVKSLEAVRSVLEGIEPFNRERTEVALRALAERLGIKTKEIFHPLRVAVTGRAVSPPLFDTLELLGKDRVLSRIDKAILHLASA
jgi:glutamyl-tRNA synthetase